MKFMFKNKSGETFPAFGCGRLKSVLSTDAATGNPVFELVKPDGQDGIYVINGPNNIIDDAEGVAFSLNEATVVLIDDGSAATAPTFGETCGPVDARWAATKEGAGLRATGVIGNRLMPVIPVSAGWECVVILDGSLAKASHALTGGTNCLATVCEWNGDDDEYVETAKQITVWNHAEATAHATNTFGYARFKDGHWHFFGDCDPMAAR